MAVGSEAGGLREASIMTTTRSKAITSAYAHDAARKARFERIVNEHYAFVWRSVRRLGVPAADLADAAQEVFLIAARNLDSIDQERGYLFRACTFVAANTRRALRRRPEVMDQQRLDEEIDGGERPDENAESKETRELLQSFLDRMPEELRAVFVLFELERFTTFEISDALGMPPGTVASRLRRGRELFMTLALRAKRQGDLR
jgi:RNA polymerase sigma-70 factor, ECF subfamily